jgi:hypothetical protein
MSEWFSLEADALDGLATTMEQYGAGAGQIVDEVLRGQGAQLIKDRIAPLIPRSGRTWKGKGRAAAAAMPASFQQDNEPQAVTIAARNKYHYLYFPDDGSNTARHAGNKQFMRRGAESASAEIIELCIGRLTEDF